MAAENPTIPTTGPGITVYAADGRRAELVLSGEIRTEDLPELERTLNAPPLSRAGEWLIDMHEVTRLELAGAYALIRAITSLREAPAVTIQGTPRMVQRTLRHTGLAEIATMT
ncbi:MULTISPECIES: STAS domain-containing protein [unclassified Streptomyces]|uniref:STAS domain-containing protein n=1 Tax=unclassified Streptomyces TaxID=2593676 RepID=UPI00331EED7C